MEDKRGIKRVRSPSTEGSHEPSDAKTPSPMLSGSPSPPGSLSEVASCRPHSPVFEQSGPSEKAPVIDLSSSSDEEDFIAITSRDFEFTQRLYGKLNRGFVGLPGDGKIIILSDFDKEKEEVCEEKFPGPKDAAASAAVNPASTTSASDANASAGKCSTPAASPANAAEDPEAAKNDSSDDVAPGPKMGELSSGGDEAGMP
jgi:hypothetical protein